MRHRHRQGAAVRDDPGAIGQQPGAAGIETRSFATTKRGVLALADWLRSWQVPAAVMEATGDYWKGPFYRLEAEGFECVLADAKQVKNLPGRPKRDPSDSSWPAQCFERGAVRPCFVATEEFRVIRLHTRYRRDLIEERTREKNRAEKLLESAAVKLSSVVTDLHGVTGRGIMGHLIAGHRDPRMLAQLAAAARAARSPSWSRPWKGRSSSRTTTPALKTMLARIDQADAEITRLSEVIEQLLAPWQEQLQQAGSQPGWGRRSAEDVLTETGPDMSKFPTGGHLVSWAGKAPLDHQSGKRQGRSRHKKGNKYVAAATGETAISAGKTDTREGARYRKLARSRGKTKACVALGNTQLKVYHKLLSNPGMRYQDLGPNYYQRRAQTNRKIAYHVRELEELGLEVTLCRPAQDDPEPPRPPHPYRRTTLTVPIWSRSAAACPDQVLFSGQ